MSTVAHRWTLKRNCSLTPGQSAGVYALLCSASFAIALVFLLQGVWMVLAFTLVEMTAVGAALLYYARHALDVETIVLTEACLLIERVDAGRREEIRLDPYWTRIRPPALRERKLIELESHGRRVCVGAYVSDAIRSQVARELKLAMRRA
ncbi:DUF2244 domain-containing protein [Massilia sp. YIM B02769]|uniref:DUF2244 domain-containing protein n=1 Tax=Massilia sp. YIM B02769 TaxID=3050129 RepID=UPI0025B6FDDF|nr:DUF2244 domain-containing protein [Massilia sp. YIM B02769]MDN4059050.1 DUF2244 domain-containing protein [Massilia sp. YIM B02769]